jgi:phosphopantetheinyl transferase (holo-ACP synthase)
MESKIKDIVSGFIKVPAEQISAATIIDRTSVSSSIILHRMYAKLAEEGVVVTNYWEVKSFGALLQQVQVNGNGNHPILSAAAELNTVPLRQAINGTIKSGVGIDMEEIASMPKASDFRENEFYRMNFSASEIAYCILQPDPYASFAGLFSAKEAIVKADNHYMNKAFNSVVIDHLADGIPTHPGFQLSISHTGQIAVAIAVQSQAFMQHSEEKPALSSVPGKNSSISWLSVISLLISLAAIAIVLMR